MRIARLKFADTSYGGSPPGSCYHIWNRVAGEPGEFPFGDAEKLELVRLLKDLAGLYTINILSFMVMGNHFHLMVHAPAEPVSPAAAINRFETYYGDRRPLPWNATEILPPKLRDISSFMHDFQFRFTCWFNRTRPNRRRGALWQGRFKSAILDARYMYRCLPYIELNPVEAGLVGDPADYPFGSWGEWIATGRHPFEENLLAHLPSVLGMDPGRITVEEVKAELHDLLVRTASWSKKAKRRGAAEINTRHWRDGMIVGSETFVRQVAAMARKTLAPCDASRIESHRLGRIASIPDTDGLPDPLRCWRNISTAAG